MNYEERRLVTIYISLKPQTSNVEVEAVGVPGKA